MCISTPSGSRYSRSRSFGVPRIAIKYASDAERRGGTTWPPPPETWLGGSELVLAHMNARSPRSHWGDVIGLSMCLFICSFRFPRFLHQNFISNPQNRGGNAVYFYNPEAVRLFTHVSKILQGIFWFGKRNQRFIIWGQGWIGKYVRILFLIEYTF